MDSTLPLYRQLNSRFYLLALSFSLLFFVGFSFYFQYEQDLAHLKYQQLPAIEKHNQQQLLLIKNDRLLNDLLHSKYAANFGANYRTLNENLNNISVLSRHNRQLLEQLIQRLQLQAENVSRLTQSERRNLQLKDSVTIQLTLVTDSLSSLIVEQANQQQILYRLITQNNLTSRATATRAKTLSNIVNNLNINRELYQGLIDTLVMFNQLDLQYDLVEFDYIQQKIQSDISLWLTNMTEVTDKTANEIALIEQTTMLNELLFSEQNTFAKWRGQLRRASDFQAEITTQKRDLIPLLDKALVVQPLKSSIIEQQLLTWLAKINISLQPKHYIWLITCVFVLLSLIFISLLLSLRKQIKHFGVQSTVVVDEFVTKGEVVAEIPGLEISAIINSIKQLTQPLHSEADFKQQQQQHQNHTAHMSRHTGNVFWQLPELSDKQQQQLRVLLGVKHANKHWRKCFSRIDVRAILSIARQAKKHKGVEKISLISNQEKAIALTIEYLDGNWCGSLSNVEEYRALKDGNTQLQQQLQQQNQADKLAIIAHSEEASVLISKAMVARQMLSLTDGDEQFAYQQLRQLISRNEQLKTSAQLRRDDFVLTLSTVTLANEMHTALTNVSLVQVHNDNLIYLNISDNLASLVTLESELFQAMVRTICQKMLTEQRGVELEVDLQVIDVNSAQQTVRMSFLVNKPSHAEMLSQMVSELAVDDEIGADFDNTVDNYLRDLQLVFNVSNKVSQQLESAGKFTFEFSLTVAENLNQLSKNKPVKLAKCTLLVIATDKRSRERICHQLSYSKAVVEKMQDLSLFQRQISIKHLTKNRLDVIILSPEVYFSDYDLITKHLASLPTKLQPKIQVIQPFHCGSLQRTGLFSASNLPWFTGELIASVAQLLSGTTKINLSVEPEIFSPYRFMPSQVEVLLGVAEQRENDALIRILHWLGLQVTVVSQVEHLERLWQSGRYLVVISEFVGFNVDIRDSVSTVRGIFAVLKNNDSKADFFHKLNLPKSWYSGYLASALDIQKLTQQLSPWLKSQTSMGEDKLASAPQKQQRKQGNKQQVVPKNTSNEIDATFEQALKLAEIDQSLDFALNLEQINNPTYDAFDLSQFAQNQGSAELAAFMLNEYLADISTNTQALSIAIETQDYPLALTLLASLTTLAKVIAATPLLAQCRQLSQLISKTGASDVFSSKQKEELQRQLNHLKLCLIQLTEFAETI
ncbi:hypothetical protein H4J38_09660 [Colwellia sp. BRX10-3]|uniref:hypothetical protein n=1 Tax=Colwellia sp. BRX10-3 TaxID=2759844 RepID=UPI0015F49F72|nr:hypothetical protein [Colwellia sp. BRX10-3]MBA6391040.1 hypothetical protein [Colwellia sp. BRX10-3]